MVLSPRANTGSDKLDFRTRPLGEFLDEFRRSPRCEAETGHGYKLRAAFIMLSVRINPAVKKVTVDAAKQHTLEALLLNCVRPAQNDDLDMGFILDLEGFNRAAEYINGLAVSSRESPSGTTAASPAPQPPAAPDASEVPPGVERERMP